MHDTEFIDDAEQDDDDDYGEEQYEDEEEHDDVPNTRRAAVSEACEALRNRRKFKVCECHNNVCS